MRYSMNDTQFIKTIQKYVAITAIGPSALRGQGAPRVVACARDYLTMLDLRRFAVADAACFAGTLDEVTEELRVSLPTKARHWGAARKTGNLFLRDSFYNIYLNRHFSLDRLEELLEIPLDSVVSAQLHKLTKARTLPRWLGLKGLTPAASAVFQTFASQIAKEKEIARVHLDADLWVKGR
jgi:hypothetical protein